MDWKVSAISLAFALALTSVDPSTAPASADTGSRGHVLATADVAAKATLMAQATGPAGAPPLKKFRVLLPFRIGITFFPISVAHELGYLREEGIDLDLQVANGSSAVVQQ